MDLNRLSSAELKALKDEVELKLEETDNRAKQELLDKFRAMSEAAGVTLEDVIGLLDARRGPVKVKYQHPTEPRTNWSGRGRTPKWLKDLEENGRDREKFRADL